MKIKITAKNLEYIHPFEKNRFANYNEDSWTRPSIKVLTSKKKDDVFTLTCELLGDNSGHYAHVMNHWRAGIKLKQIGYAIMANGYLDTDTKPLEVADDAIEIIKVEHAD